MSLQPVFGEPNGYPMSDDQIVDQLIGNAYKIVKFVAERMSLIRTVADNIIDVTALAASIENINNLANNITSVNAVAGRLIEIQALHADLGKLVALYPQIGMFGTIHANLAFLQTLPALAGQVAANVAAAEVSAENAAASEAQAQAHYEAMLLLSINSNPMTTPQDIIVGGVAGAPTRLAMGLEGTSLQVRDGLVVWEDQPALSSLALGGPPAYPWAITVEVPPPTSTLTVAIPEMVVQFPFTRWTLPPTNVTVPPNTIRDVWITDQGQYHFEDKALSEYWMFPRYDTWMHYARIQSSATKVQGVYMRRATKPIPLRPSPRQFTDYHFEEYHAIPTSWETWVDGMAAVRNVVYRTERGDLWKCYTEGVAEIAPEGPTFDEEANSGYDLVPSGTAVFTFRGRSAYAGALRVSARSGITWYFSTLAAGLMAGRLPALIKDYLKSVAFHVVNEWISGASYTEGRKVAGPVTQGRVWECVVGGNTTATPPFTANAVVGAEVTEGTVVWRCIGNYAHPDQKFFWYDVEPTLRRAKSPDSHDSYAACWIWAVYRYLKANPTDTAWLNEVTVQNGLTYQELMREVIYHNLTTQILANKLTKTFQGDGVPFGGTYSASFFMDNTEVWAGFAAAESIWTTFIPDAPYAATMVVWKDIIAEGLESLWEPETGTYKYVQGLASMAPAVPGGALFYPLCMSQAWGFLWGVPLDKVRMYKALDYMNANYPNWWARNDIDDLLALGAHYAYVVASGSDLGKTQILDRVETERLIPGQADLYIMDAAYYLVIKDSVNLRDLDKQNDLLGVSPLDLSASSGSSLMGTIAAETGAVIRTAEEKLRDSLSIKDFGASLVFDSTQEIANALANTANNALISLAGGEYDSTVVNNPLGKRFGGGGGVNLPAAVGGKYRATVTDDYGKVFTGKEYLWRFFLRIKAGGALTGFIYGDSTAATAAMGGGYAGTAFEPQNLLPELLFRGKGIRSPMNFTNRAVGGSVITAMNPIADLDTVTGATDLMIFKVTINEQGMGAAAFATALREKLASLRSNPFGTPSNLSIVLMGGSTFDPASGRPPEWYTVAMNILRQAGRDYKCAVFDTYAYLNDMSWTAGTAMDNPYSNGQAIHPLDIMQSFIWGGLVDNMVGADAVPFLKGSWPTFASTVESSSGSGLVATIDMTYMLSRDACEFQASISITAQGTSGGFVKILLPKTPLGIVSASGVDVATAKAITGRNAGGAYIGINYYDGSYPGLVGSVLTLSGRFNYS